MVCERECRSLCLLTALGPRIYLTLGIDTQTSLMIIGISGTLAVLYTTAALYFIDKVGRKWPLVVGALGCGFSLLVTAVLSQYFPPGPDANQNSLRAQVAMNFVLNFFFVALGVISWVYPSEIFPTELRAKGNSVTTMTNWCTGLLFAQISPIALGKIGFKYFYVFFVFDMIAAACFTLFYPETKGFTLEQIDAVFGGTIVPQGENLEALEKNDNFHVAEHEKV
jgi:MFS family permease